MSGLPQVCAERTPAHLLHGVHHLRDHREENQVVTFSSNPSPIVALPCPSLSCRDLTDVTLAYEDHTTSPFLREAPFWNEVRVRGHCSNSFWANQRRVRTWVVTGVTLICQSCNSDLSKLFNVSFAHYQTIPSWSLICTRWFASRTL